MNNKRIRDYGTTIGSLPTGPENTITDVEGVTVGHCTIDTDAHKTGVTVIMPSKENIFQNKLTAAAFVLNGFGKTTGIPQIQELGTLESPIALTNTLNVGLVQNALVDYMIHRCAEDDILLYSFNAVVGECNDCFLNDIRHRAVQKEHVYHAIETASREFEQGDVGAGKGTICFGFKGGIGSSSRQIKIDGHTYTLGVLVQSNFGKTEDFILNGNTVGKKLAQKINPSITDKGSVISVIATDLPVSDRQLGRILKRAAVGLGRTGSMVGHGSGDIMIGFSTANVFPTTIEKGFHTIKILREDKLDLAFQAVIEAEEEAVLNSMVAADTVIGWNGEMRFGLGTFLEDDIK
ncbi:MAG: P1 family peptidase [Schaedlerella sp.]|nr:P1 family peptidase [Schaedlerella sp.]